MLSSDLEKLHSERWKIGEKANPKYEYTHRRNVLPVEKRLSISLEGLDPDMEVLSEWARAVANVRLWLDEISPELVILSGRSQVVLDKCLTRHSFIYKVIRLNEEETDILYKTDCGRLHCEEDFYEDYCRRGTEYEASFRKRQVLLEKIMGKKEFWPERVVALDDKIGGGSKAHFVQEFLRQQGMWGVEFGALVGPAETNLAFVGSTNPDFYKFLGNLINVEIALLDKKKFSAHPNEKILLEGLVAELYSEVRKMK